MPSHLTPDDIKAFASAHPRWVGDGESITRTFEFSNFNEAMGFVTRVGIASEAAAHHPDIDIRWNRVTLLLTTHDQADLTAKDLHLAAQLDTFVGE